MGDEGDYWRDVKPVYKQRSKVKREGNKNSSTNWLKNCGFSFESHNNGIHLVVSTRKGIVDFWPSTGKWIARDSGKTGRRVKGILDMGHDNE